MVDITKFKWQELFNDSKGKTSLTKVLAPIIVLTGCVLPFIYIEHITSAIIYVTIGSGLIAQRRATKDKEVTTSDNIV